MPEQAVDEGLIDAHRGTQRVGAGGEGCQFRSELVEFERLDEVVRGAAVERAGDGVELSGRGDHDDSHGVALAAQLLQHLQTGHIGQIHVQQDQIGGVQRSSGIESGGAGVGDLDGAETVDAVDETAVDVGDHEVVVDDQHFTHESPT